MQQGFFEQRMVDALPIGAAIFTGPEHTVKAINREMLVNWAKDESVIGKSFHEVFPELQDQAFFDLMADIYRTGQAFHEPHGKVTLMIAGLPQTFYFDYWFKPIKGVDGDIVGIMNTAVDVTEKISEQARAQQAAEELKAVNEQLSAAKEAAQFGLFDWDLINHKYSWDTRFKEMFGLSPEDNPEHFNVIIERLHPDDRALVRKAIAEARNQELTGGKYDIEYRIIGAGNVPMRWARALGKVIFDQDGTPVRFIGTLMDITDIAINRQQLEASEERMRLAIDSAELGTWFINTETREITSSPRVKEMYGFYADEEMSLDAAMAQIAPEYRDMIAEAINAAIDKGESYDVQCPIIGFHDGKLRWVRATGKLYAGELNQTPIFSGTIADITAQKQNEQRKNDFISMVSHELKTPLTSLNGYVQILQTKARKANDHFTTGMLDRSYHQIRRMTKLIYGFLNVSQLEAGKIQIERKRFDMAVLLKDVQAGIVQEATSHKIIFDPVMQTWVNVDQDKIEQVVNNLISNAIKYAPPYTTVQIACVTKGEYAHVSVKDEGMGMRLEDQARVFERFYRVEGQQTQTISGFGIGLYICKEIIERHDGQIGVESEPGKGSTFWFTLPLEPKG
jgi:two-component system sensor histidine kinase VicK